MAGTFGPFCRSRCWPRRFRISSHRPADEIKGDRRLWTAVSFVNFVGPIAYFLFGRKRCC